MIYHSKNALSNYRPPKVYTAWNGWNGNANNLSNHIQSSCNCTAHFYCLLKSTPGQSVWHSYVNFLLQLLAHMEKWNELDIRLPAVLWPYEPKCVCLHMETFSIHCTTAAAGAEEHNSAPLQSNRIHFPSAYLSPLIQSNNIIFGAIDRWIEFLCHAR